MKTVMVTGGAGFFGGILKRTILESGDRAISVDVCPDEDEHPNLDKRQIDLRDREALDKVFASTRIDGVVHCAAMLAHGSEDPKELWTSNVDGTRNLMDAMRKYGVRQHVFTSTNCLWGEAMGRPVREDDPPNPVELYGRSKLEAERIILDYPDINCCVVLPSSILGGWACFLFCSSSSMRDGGYGQWAEAATGINLFMRAI